ncbi:MAG: 2-keto-4-pentenoate hydratase [Nocardioides sp.]
MTVWTEESVASELLACEAERRDRARFTDEWPELDLRTGYRIQDETLRRRLARGERLTGLKLGLTSRAKQRRMGLDTPLVAWLTDGMVLRPGDQVPQDKLIHPRIEPEIVFVMASRLCGPGVTAAQALAAVDRVYAGAEIIDSRFTDFKFAASDVVADNASSGAYVVAAGGVSPGSVDLVGERVLVEIDGVVVDQATGAAVLGDPAEALALGANELAKRGLAIEPGWIVLTGGMTDAVAATPGSTVACRFATLGDVVLDCGPGASR